MSATEEFEGFVPVTVYLAQHRIEGKAWKFANRRLLQQIEEDKREFLPLVQAQLFFLGGESETPAQFEVLAVSKSQIIAIEPKDVVTSRVGR